MKKKKISTWIVTRRHSKTITSYLYLLQVELSRAVHLAKFSNSNHSTPPALQNFPSKQLRKQRQSDLHFLHSVFAFVLLLLLLKAETKKCGKIVRLVRVPLTRCLSLGDQHTPGLCRTLRWKTTFYIFVYPVYTYMHSQPDGQLCETGCAGKRFDQEKNIIWNAIALLPRWYVSRYVDFEAIWLP